MKNLSSKNIITFFIFLLLTSGVFNLRAAENEMPMEEYVPELMKDGSVVFNKKLVSEVETPDLAPAIKLRSASITCCKTIRIGQTVKKLCKQMAGTQCPAGTAPQ